MSQPSNVGQVFNGSATSNADILAADLAPDRFASAAYRITVGIKPGGSASVINAQVNSGGTAILLALNGGVALTAGVLYTFVMGVSSSYTYNFQMATTTTLGVFLVEEIREGTL